MTGQEIFDLISNNGYWILFPMMIIEGPVATIIAALLAALGAFNVFVVLGLSILGDMIGDVILYYFGYRWGMAFVDKIGKYMGITAWLVEKLKKYYVNHSGKIVFVAKSTTGMAWAAMVVSGIVKMNFKKFLRYSFLGGVVWSTFLVSMGYFYGYLWREISQYIKWIGWVIGGLLVISFILLNLYKKYRSKKVFRENNNENMAGS